MVAQTQYTWAGDNTVDAISLAVEEAEKGDLVIVISDANLDRYDITVKDLNPLQSQKVHARKSDSNTSDFILNSVLIVLSLLPL
jgi:hypothetical protein